MTITSVALTLTAFHSCCANPASLYGYIVHLVAELASTSVSIIGHLVPYNVRSPPTNVHD